jgi:hypothetical protein
VGVQVPPRVKGRCLINTKNKKKTGGAEGDERFMRHPPPSSQ